MTETALVLLEDVIPDALLYHRRGPVDGDNESMLRAFVEVDRATMGPERLAAKLTSYERSLDWRPEAQTAPWAPQEQIRPGLGGQQVVGGRGWGIVGLRC